MKIFQIFSFVLTYARQNTFTFQTENEAKRPEYPGHSASWNPNLNIGKLDTATRESRTERTKGFGEFFAQDDSVARKF